ncbi:PIG-L deacetylase family protein [Engelhardtia mirabilis]|uniref:1D-myo-inositol 2-acetamido-2-deoxy-alpha-D-glucopyranoside deacetylase n=1 Tax=Engelhardtia mirabilis TaxID=2528011 RepID=A0A518BI93_9BACT|nr:1D-myo-inositol 2-acetamido-2-deoxy-alpha-D-glucopyranoside deacetylase [Planctomycetes bacterium Pla133]QDV01018.1 1D-myo-inositol 2-acetamido-2-deoxy-alpha-D-glucopyranoside deacetylase [Planctomycetes bacterium Pla86]
MSEQRSPLPEVVGELRRGPVLLLAPHPDDDLIGPGCTAGLHAAQGDQVHVVVVYDGAAGNAGSDLPREEFIALRQREARAGGAHLGLSSYEFWGYPEGHEPGPAEFQAGVERLAAVIADKRPATVYAPWIGEHHVDHHVLAKVTRAALELAGFQGEAWGYEVWSALVPTRVVDITELFERKAAGLREHRSQLAHTDLVHCIRGLNAHRSLYLPRGGEAYAEGFAPL